MGGWGGGVEWEGGQKSLKQLTINSVEVVSSILCEKWKEQWILHSVLRYSDIGPVLKELKTLFSYVCNICFQLKALKHCFKKLTRLSSFNIYIDLVLKKFWFPLILKRYKKKQYVCKFNTKKKKLNDYWYQWSFFKWEIDN